MSTIKKTTAKSPAPSATKRKRRRAFRVKLPLGPSSVIDRCASPEEAYERFKQTHGIIASDYEPEIEPI